MKHEGLIGLSKNTQEAIEFLETEIKDIENAIDYFSNEIYQFGIVLDGILDDDYREYIEKKKHYYELSKDSLSMQVMKKQHQIHDFRMDLCGFVLDYNISHDESHETQSETKVNKSIENPLKKFVKLIIKGD